MGFDIAVGIVLFLGAVRGFKKGFARQILTVSSLVIALVFADPLAKHFPKQVHKLVEDYPADIAESMLGTGALLLIFLLINGAGTLYLYVYRTRSLGVNTPSLGDRIVGIGMGVAIAAFIACIGIATYRYLPSTIRENDLVQSHYEKSRAIKLAEENQIAEKVWETQEVQRAYLHMGRLVNYIRSSNAASSTADEPHASNIGS